VGPEPLDADSAPPPDRYCDLVLTGGVTDGVVYPWAVVELARHYRFKNIGGTSVGAMAAALTAAAEFSRRHGYLFGFNKVMMQIPERLAECVPGVGTRIFSLFQPDKSTEKLFKLFVAFFSSKSESLSLQGAAAAHIGGVKREHAKARRPPRTRAQRAAAKIPAFGSAITLLFKALLIVASVYRCAAFAGAVIGLVLFVIVMGFGLDGVMPAFTFPALALVVLAAILIGAPLIVFWVLLFVGLEIRDDVLQALVRNHYGICTGMRPKHIPEDRPSLVEWLHKGIQLAAGKPLDEPLTFGDLWNAPGGPSVPDLPLTRRRKSRSIDLRMITTNVTHGRPYEFPVDRETPIFFKASELTNFFPPTVMDHLVQHARTYKEACDEHDDLPLNPGEQHLLELPTDELPVVVAARLSLSFPFLFSAIPLWEVDRESEDKTEWSVRRCRYSDGGICSNFPIHMFDAAVPEWPTFGIALEARRVFRPQQDIWLTERYDRGGEESWFRFDEPHPITKVEPTLSEKLMGFVGAIFYSAKDWNDKSAIRLPGIRDRIVHVALTSTSGGLNLRIPGREIMHLARTFGAPAGRALVQRFIERDQPGPAWEEHRWVRFHSFLAGLRARIEMFRDAAENHRYGVPMSAHIHEATQRRPLSGTDSTGRKLADDEAADLKRLLESVEQLERLFAQSSLPQPYRPIPMPGLHLRAPL
jgi:predicted acylesterase/phospholipase RssA